MRTISMGLNTEPEWRKEAEVTERFLKMGNQEGLENFRKRVAESIRLRDEIVKEIEKNGEVKLSWDCMGETRHTMHSQQWATALPEYEFEIGRYLCVVRKRK